MNRGRSKDDIRLGIVKEIPHSFTPQVSPDKAPHQRAHGENEPVQNDHSENKMPRMCMLAIAPRLNRQQPDQPAQANLQGEISGDERMKRIEIRNIQERE